MLWQLTMTDQEGKRIKVQRKAEETYQKSYRAPPKIVLSTEKKKPQTKQKQNKKNPIPHKYTHTPPAQTRIPYFLICIVEWMSCLLLLYPDQLPARSLQQEPATVNDVM